MFKFNKTIKFGDITLSKNSPACIMAEIGLNHNGEFGLAKKMVDEAAGAGADIVKFQTYKTEEFLSNSNEIFEYKVNGKIRKEYTHKMFKRLELPYSWHKKLLDYCCKKSIQFLSTPCDIKAVDLLLDIGVPALKISSEDLININLVEYAAKKGIPVILSTGMADKSEIDTAVGIFKEYNNKNLILLHCTSIYPTADSEVNLGRMLSIARRYGVLTGYSDHTNGIKAALSAVCMGAVIIEKHFTLSKKMSGPDHSFSSGPNELKRLIKRIRSYEKLKGCSKIEPSISERAARLKYRRSIVASRDIKSGTRLTENYLAYKRPGSGLKPIEGQNIIGKRIINDVKKDEQILSDNLKAD